MLLSLIGSKLPSRFYSKGKTSHWCLMAMSVKELDIVRLVSHGPLGCKDVARLRRGFSS